jgi:NaMN:DMB phosphoribosyltransferase
MRPSLLATAFGGARALFGVAVLAAPGRITRSWVGTDDPPALVMARCLGGRDVALGAGTALAAARERDPVPWLVAGVVADVIDGAATVAAGDRIPRRGRLQTLALVGAGALIGGWLVRAVD